MNTTSATAEVFMTALKALPRKERDSVLARIAQDKDLRNDLLDLTTIANRRREPSRPFRKFLAEKQK